MEIALKALLPNILLGSGAMLILLLGAFFKKLNRIVFSYLGAIVALASLYVIAFGLRDAGGQYFSGTLLVDNLSVFSGIVVVLGTVLTLLMSAGYVERRGDSTEYYALVLFAAVGMIAMTWTLDLIMIFIGLEIMSVSSYILTGYFTDVRRSTEASLKYFLAGAFSSGVLLFGLAVVYGLTGTSKLSAIRLYFLRHSFAQVDPFFVMGVGALMVGFLFKIAAFPFHAWSPDAYEGAPTPIAGFMSVGTKAAAFIALIRVISVTLMDFDYLWAPLLVIVSILTMTLGNVVALTQHGIKRMLAYSSIAHAGYMLVGIVAASEVRSGFASILFYLMVYTFMNLGAFGVAMYAERKTGGEINLSNLRGLGYSMPLAGLGMAVFMFSLAGIPPMSGFFAKFYIFSAAVKAGYIKLVVIAVINSLISVYFYLRVLVFMFMKDERAEDRNVPLFQSLNLEFVITLALIVTVVFGLWPSILLKFVGNVLNTVI